MTTEKPLLGYGNASHCHWHGRYFYPKNTHPNTHTSNHVSACCRIQCSKFFTILCDALFLVEISLPILKWHQHWTFSFGRLFSINLIFCFVEICFINRTWQNFHILNSLQKSGTYSVESFSGVIVNTQKTDLFNANKPAKNMYSILFYFLFCMKLGEFPVI